MTVTVKEREGSNKRLPGFPPTWPRAYRIFRALARPPLRAMFGMHCEGFDRVPWGTQFFMTPNHVSMLDWAFLQYFMPKPIRFVVHRDYWDQAVTGFGLRINGAVAIRTDRPDIAALRLSLSLLEAGESLILFPEGGISLDGRPQAGHPGVIALSSKLRIPIVPVAIRGAFEAFPRNAAMPRRHPVTVVFGEPIPPPPLVERSEQQELATRLMLHVGQLLDGVSPTAPWGDRES